ncbi:MAG TPA: PA2779 family protein [Burkholderiales bacterium]|nr:PA2779 family protein [Burkholderiales bacterium]
MKHFCRFICRVLIASLIFLPCGANAGMITTDQVVAGAQDAPNREKVREFLSRRDVARQLQALGISSASAQERVRAMTAQEVDQLAGNIDQLPAGGVSGWVWVIVVLFIAGILYTMYGPDQTWSNRPL